jgi:2-polyprenyl-3-methyl-5-hydroxy-6-metoxy-1,4-benzoquinol methylase
MPSELPERVRAAYNEVSALYRGDADAPANHVAWTADLSRRLQRRGDVLDLGCGCGIPVARDLARDGHAVTGVDLSDVQIERARQLVPAATFLRADATAVSFGPQSFDAIICLYALIHMPLDEQPALLRRCATWLRPGGWLLATTGHRAWTGTEANWLGGTATMHWSHADADTYRHWLTAAGFTVAEQQFVPEGDGGHALFWAQLPVAPRN